MSYVGGKLKLKGKTLQANGGVEKKKRKDENKTDKEIADVDLSMQKEGQSRGSDNIKTKKLIDYRTEAEKRRDEALAARKEEGVKKLAEKSYRQRVEEYNKYLSTLSEHHDIPKVGPG
mmetsp:Transcript_3641/g.22816  ORF Transcript_3641/g.22816 Transcript_3641/m.22816 type:complete len:118 (-) Transcript_3641:2100-2453(-)